MKITDRVVVQGCPSEGGPLAWTLRGHQTWDPLGSSSPNGKKIKNADYASLVNPHHTDADTDPTYQPDADPDSDYYLMGIRMRMRIRLFSRIRIQIIASK
jgi:hypothetical protein